MDQDPRSLALELADRYRLERELGRGGMAVVHLAYDPRHDRQVALKVIRADIVHPGVAERFAREISRAWLRVDPDFGSLRGYPPFERLLAAGPL